MDPILRIRNLLAPMTPIPTGLQPSTHPLNDIRAVLFDVYGTLFISGSGDIGLAAATDNDIALREALSSAGLPEDAARLADWLEAVHASHERSRARGIEYPEIEIRAVWQQVVRSPASMEQIEALAMEYECRVNPVWPMPAMRETLAALRDCNLLLGIISNAQFFTPLLFEACLHVSPTALSFRPALCAWSYESREAKPAAHLFAPVAAHLERQGIQPDQTLYVGNDMLNDIWTASALGFRTCLFAGDERSLRLRTTDPRCQALRPDRIITALDQLPAMLAAGPG